MSDNEDLLGDDLEDHSLADYNLGNDEEDQLLADDYDGGITQNVPTSVEVFRESSDMVPSDYSGHGMEYGTQPTPYQPVIEAECVVPNIVVEVPNVPPIHSTYAPYEPRHYEPEHSVPLAMPAVLIESPQIVPSEVMSTIPNDMARERFISERPVGVQRMPQVRDIPDSLDKVVVSGNMMNMAGRRAWRSAQYNARFQHPYRRNNQRGNFSQRSSFPPPMPSLTQNEHPPLPAPPMPQIPLDMQDRPMEMSREMPRPPFPPDRLMEMNQPNMDMGRPNTDMQRPMDMGRPNTDMQRPPMDMGRPSMDMQRPSMDMERPPMDMQRPHMDMQRPNMDMQRPHMDMQRPHMDMQRPHMDMQRPHMDMQRPHMDMQRPHMDMQRPNMDMQRPQFQYQRFPFREERPMFNQMRPQFERPMYFPRQQFQRFGPPMPQVTIRQNLDKKEPEIRMLPVPLPANLPGLAGKKVLINPHFKGNFQPVDGLSLPTYIPTRIQKSPPLSPTLDKLGKQTASPIKDIDDAAERFIVEQRNALARAAGRKFARRSPQRYIENTTIEIENELARRPARRRSDDDDLLRRQEEFIHANRAGLRRRMRSPSPRVSRSPSPPGPAAAAVGGAGGRRADTLRHRPYNDEDIDYKRRVREQEDMRERVLRAKEVRRRKNAVLYNKQMQDREREEIKDQPQKEPPAPTPKLLPTPKPQPKPAEKPIKPVKLLDKPEDIKPDTTKKTPERECTPEPSVRSPVKNDEVNSTCAEELTPPPLDPPARELTPPVASDDELELILGDIDGILSDDDDLIVKPKDKPIPVKAEPAKAKPMSDLRTKLPAKLTESNRPQRQKIIFTEERDEKRDIKKKKEKSVTRKPVVSSTKMDNSEITDNKSKTKSKEVSNKSRPRIIFETKNLAKVDKEKADKASGFSSRRVILQRKPSNDSKSVFSRIEVTSDPSQPNAGIFSRAVRTLTLTDRTERHSNRIVIKNEPQIEYDSSSDDGKVLDEELGNIALVDNLPHGMTDTRLNTLAGDVQSLILDKEERSAKITFKTTAAAENFKKKFNNKMVAASRLTVTLQ